MQLEEIIKQEMINNPEMSAGEIARKLIKEGLAVHPRTITKKISRIKKRENKLQEFVTDYQLDKADIKNVTINEWTVTSFKNGKPNTYTNTQIKVKAEPSLKTFNFEEHLKEYQSPKFESHNINNDSIALINIYDAHIDKMSFKGNSTVQNNLNTFTNCFSNLFSSVYNYNPNTIVFPVGSDFFNTNSLSKFTKKGTIQDTSTLPHIAFDLGLKAIRSCIDIAKTHSNIYIPIIQGNHDEDTCFYLGKCLSFIYENDDRVTIDDSYSKRKYFNYKDILLGFAHGSLERRFIDKLPLVMAQEQKELWGNTEFRYWFLGDIHHKQEYRFLRTKDSIGVEVNFLRAISEVDQWHNDNGYIGIHKSAEASIFAKNKGEIAKFKVNI